MDFRLLQFLERAFLPVAAATLLAMAVAQHSRGETHEHPAEDSAIHERFYSQWQRPDMRNEQGERHMSCCNKRDCYPTEFKNVGGTWFAQRREDGEWIPIPASKLEQNLVDGPDNPDGRNHVCMQPPGSVNMVFCAILGGGT